jgi:hypothetical protein
MILEEVSVCDDSIANFHLKTGLGDFAEITIQCAMFYINKNKRELTISDLPVEIEIPPYTFFFFTIFELTLGCLICSTITSMPRQ